jgi:hypothetical protein
MLRLVSSLSALGLMIAVAGCGDGSGFTPKLAPVKGTVKVDGAPVAGLTVSFEPQSSSPSAKTIGQPSSGITDASGAYELTYTGGDKGAVVGKHIVRVSNMAAEAPDPAAATGASNVKIPETYNTNSTLNKEVKSGPNTIDLDIKTK